MKIYIISKGAIQELGEFCLLSVEKAFADKAKAEEYAKAHPVVWNEKINGVSCVCERAIHEVELEQ